MHIHSGIFHDNPMVLVHEQNAAVLSMSRAVAPRRWAPADSVACCQAAARTVREFRTDGLAGSIPKKHRGISGAMEMGE